MEITDASLLGYNNQRQYFEGEIFVKGNIQTVTVEGYVIDFTVGPQPTDISSSVALDLKNIFAGLGDEAWHAAETSSLSNYNLSQGLAVNDIIINKINHGKGKIVSIRMTSSPATIENKVIAGKYEITFEFFGAIHGGNFNIEGEAGTDDYNLYNDGIEDVLRAYAHRLSGFSESFNYDRGSGGEEQYNHSVNILAEDDGVRDNTGTIANIIGTAIPATPANLATYIAWKIYNTPHSYLPQHWAKTFNLTSSSTGFYAPHDAFFTESVNNITGECRFNKKWMKTIGLKTSSTDNVVNTGYNGLYHFEHSNQQFCAKFSYSISHEPPKGVTCIERADIICVGKGLASDGDRSVITEMDEVFKKVSADSLDRCQDAVNKMVGTGHTLANVSLDSRINEAPQENKYGYDVTFSSDPDIIQAYSGFRIERRVSMTRDAAGIKTFTQDSKATPIKQATDNGVKIFANDGLNEKNELLTNHSIQKIMGLISGNILPRVNYFTNNPTNLASDIGWIRYFYAISQITNPLAQFTLMKTDVNVEPTGGFNTGTISVQNIWTSDPVMTQQWFLNQPNIQAANYKTFFTKKELSVENKNPVRKKESYMVAGWGEVVHASMQSEIGTVTIQFSGILARHMEWNSVINGVPIPTSYLKLAIREAVIDSMNYFGIFNAQMVFITDTSYSFTSGRELSVSVTLSYTRPSRTEFLENRLI